MEKTPLNCKECNSSLSLPPTDREVKRGSVETLLYCCDQRARVVYGKETFPQLCDLVRQGARLCGSKAKWWIPLVVMPYDQIVHTKKANGSVPVPPYRKPTGPRYPVDRKVLAS